jgi:PhzF family phenazine biosynthesis protein
MEVLEYVAFTTDPAGGNPAGVVLDADDLDDAAMLAIAAELGHSETAFLSRVEPGAARIRYFTPRAEIAFCGHATIASTVVLAERGVGGTVVLRTNAGDVPVEARDGRATLLAVDTPVEPLAADLLDALLAALRLTRARLDPALPPALVHGGNTHPLVVVADAAALDGLDPDAAALLALQDREGWDGTVPVLRRTSATTFESRNPFPRGGIREDPATGSAAAGLGAYLRAGGHITPPATVHVHQGRHIGRPSVLEVTVPATGRIAVTGTAVPLRGPAST